MTERIDQRVILRLAAEAECDIRTAKRFLLGQRMKGLIWCRVRDAAVALGLDVPEQK